MATETFETGKKYKEAGDQSFKAGDYKKALGSYYFAITHLEGLDKNAMSSMGMNPPQSRAETEEDKPLSEIDDLISKVYGNMSACHMSLKNYQRAIETADKALKKNAKNYKVLFRKGKAVGEQGWYERACKILEEVKSKSPEDAAKVDAEIARLRVVDQAKEKATSKKLKGFLNKKNATLALDPDDDDDVEEISSPGVKSS